MEPEDRIVTEEKKYPYWTLKTSGYGWGPEVMKVTSEKGGYRAQCYGSVNGVSTHARATDCYGKFESEEAAEAKIEAYRQVEAKHDPAIEEVERALSKLRSIKYDELMEVLRS
jgi:hypothetical protein